MNYDDIQGEKLRSSHFDNDEKVSRLWDLEVLQIIIAPLKWFIIILTQEL